MPLFARKPDLPELESARLKLLPPSTSLAEKALEYQTHNRTFFEPWSPLRGDHFFTHKGQQERLKRQLDAFVSMHEVRFFLFKKDDPEYLIGEIGCSNIVEGAAQCGTLGYQLHKDELSQGYTTEGLQAIIDFLFKEVKLHRLEANIMPRNEASVRVIEKLGFVKEGHSKDYLNINGNWEDHFRYAILNPNHL